MTAPQMVGALILAVCVLGEASAQNFADALVESTFDALVESTLGTQICSELEPLPQDSCKSFLKAASSDAPVDLEALEAAVRDELTSPEFLNSTLSRAFGGSVPLGLEFKQLDGTNGSPVLGLSYSINHELAERGATSDGNWNRRYSVAFNATGTYTKESQENPRNFLDTNLKVYGSRATRIPEQTREFGAQLTEYALGDAQCEREPNSPECLDAQTLGYAMLDSAAEFLNSFRYYEYGIDAGVESDQDFEVKQSKFSAFVFGQFESWGGNSLLDSFNLTPAFRIGLDSVDPNSNTPRAVTGDDSSYIRFSGEVSLWVPLETRVPIAFTFNYRHYREIDASSIVKAANLDSYDIRTFSLTGASGLFVSYSSGRLPFDLQSDDVVELGWKYYF